MRKGAVYRRSGGWGYRVDVAPDPETGRRRQRSQQGFGTKRAAVVALERVIADTEPPRFRPADPATVRQVAGSWLERKAIDCTPSTLVAYERAVDKIADRLGDVPVDRVTVAMIDEFERELLDPDVDPLVVSQRLGHSTFATTKNTYGPLFPPLLDRNLDDLEHEISGIGS